MVYQLVYSSSARRYLTASAAQRIAEVSAERNAALGITGVLLYLDGTIFQVLEGDRENVQALYTLIELDSRHSSAMILLQREVPTREFEGWSMGFRDIAVTDLPDGLIKATPDNIRQILPAIPSAQIAALTRAFAQVA